MAGVSVGHSGGRKKSLDAEVNLVPFIDLLSMCICFLLMTAVWIDLSSINVKQSSGTAGPADTAQKLDLEVQYQRPNQIETRFKLKGKVVSAIKIEAADGAKLNSELETRVAAELKKLNQDPKAVGSAIVTPSSAVNYGDMVGVMDTLRRLKIMNLGVSYNSAAAGAGAHGGG